MEGGPPGAHETGGAPREGGRALHSRGLVLAPPAVFSVPKNPQIFHQKIILDLQGIWSTSIFGIFFNARIIQETDSKKRVQKVVPSSFIHLMIIKMNPLTRLIKSC